MKPRLLLGDIAARRLWGAEAAAIRSADILEGTFPQQRVFIEDPAKLKWALCTRRSAKSYSDGLALAKAALERPDVSCLYIGLTRESAKRIMWKDVLKAINRRHKLGIRFNESELSARFPNGSVIYLVGADSNEDERQKLLGQKFVLVVIDEAQAFGIDLRQLVYGVLKPAVADYRGTIVLTGTPGNLIKGLFFDVTTGREAGWSGHRWTTYDNPYMAEQWAGEIADLKAASPLVVETPWFRQMYLGEWVIDLDKLVYRFNPDRNTFAELPTFHAGEWHYVLGVDLGYNDPTAFALCAYHDYDKTLYVLEAQKHARLDVTGVAERIRAFQARYELDSIVIDGANKQAVEEMRRRHDLPLRAADKTGKSDFIEIMNGEFIQARIKLDPARCAPLADEYAGLIWDERSAKREEHPNCPNDLADATLYAWRLCQLPLRSRPFSAEDGDSRVACTDRGGARGGRSSALQGAACDARGSGAMGPAASPLIAFGVARRAEIGILRLCPSAPRIHLTLSLTTSRSSSPTAYRPCCRGPAATESPGRPAASSEI